MRHLAALAVSTALFVTPAVAEDSDMDQGLDLLSQGTQLLLQGLMNEIEPTLRDIKPSLEAFGPMLQDLQGLLGNGVGYHAPEVLPNGDIIIRRRQDAPLEDGEIEL